MNDIYWKEQLAREYVRLLRLDVLATGEDEGICQGVRMATANMEVVVDMVFGDGFSSLLGGYSCTDMRVKLEDLIDIWECSGKCKKSNDD